MKVQELLKHPKSWTQTCLARDAFGRIVGPRSFEAKQWCLIGAVLRCYMNESEMSRDERWDEIDLAVYQKHHMKAAAWNDASDRTHAEVLALVKELDI